jgi:type I restriction enzyme M protein
VPSHHIRSRIEAIWEVFWRAGMVDPVEITEQVLYLLFLRLLDALPAHGRRPGCALAQAPLVDWSMFKDLPAAEMFGLLTDHVFPRLRRLGGAGSAYAQHMKDARFSIPDAPALANVVKLLEALPRPAGSHCCEAYDYLCAAFARSGPRGEFYTPRHVARLMVDLVSPCPADIVCSPVVGDGQFLVEVGQYLAHRHADLFDDPERREHFHHRMFHAYDADKTMLRIASMNMALFGVGNPAIRYTNSVATDLGGDENKYSVLLAHPSTALLRTPTKATTVQAEIAMVAQFVRLLKLGGRAAVIVPQHILGGMSAAHLELRRSLVHEQRLDGVIAFPCGLSGTHAGAPKTILWFTRTDCGGRDHVWFHDVQPAAWPADPVPTRRDDHSPGTKRRSRQRGASGMANAGATKRLCVRKQQIADAGDCLTSGRYDAAGELDR